MATAPGIPIWRDVGAAPLPVASGGVDAASIVIVGAGPVGLALALDLGRRGLPVTVLNKSWFVAAGSKAICFSKRSLDVFDRLGVGEGVAAKGVTWNTGKVFWGGAPDPIYQFDLLPERDQRRPAFVNIQQYHVETMLIDALGACPSVDVRWGHGVTGVAAGPDGVRLTVGAGSGHYLIDADWVVACDGSRSPMRELMGLEFDGRVFEDNFLIADIKMKRDLPSERWFWFDPPFNPGQSALLHKQPDDVWRLDFQLGWNVDREAAMRPENVEPLVRAMLGDDAEFTREWYSVYTFQCRRMARFVHGRVIFAGDSAHLVSPFGARGCNGGLADADQLGWKLARVVGGSSPASLLGSYDYEAGVTADENIGHSSRTADFLTPKTTRSRHFRDAALELASEEAFARPFVNSGRLSAAVAYPASPLNTPDRDHWRAGPPPGSPPLDAPLGDGWLLGRLGDDFVLLANGWTGGAIEGCVVVDMAGLADAALVHGRYALDEGAAYLIRPDQYVAARWTAPTSGDVRAALARATGAAPCR